MIVTSSLQTNHFNSEKSQSLKVILLRRLFAYGSEIFTLK